MSDEAGAAATNANTKALQDNTRAIDTDLASNTSDALLDAVRELTRVVKALQVTMKEYPNRNEIKLNYATRRETRKRRWQISFAMVAAIVASYFFTVGSVSYCFLGGIPDPGTHDFCQIFPGYTESFDNNRRSVKIFTDLQTQVKQNQADIDELKHNK
jgi:hypothetical protein